MLVKTFENIEAGQRLEIYYDEIITLADELEFYERLTVFYKHPRYILGDKEIDPRNFDNEEALIAWLKEEHNAKTIMPLYAYEHGMITVSTGPFSCPWDSGQVGFVVSTEEDDEKSITSLVKTMDMILQNEVYYVSLSKLTKCDKGHTHAEDVDGVHGIFDDTVDYSECQKAATEFLGWKPLE